ncbi:MAG: DMT family transporter, partial [Pseudomonadota bacterium]
ILGALFGALIVGVFELGLRMYGADPQWTFLLIGALIIIRPGTDVFQPAALLPLCAATCFAGFTLITRKVGPQEDVWTSLFYTGVVGAVVLSAFVPFVLPPLDARSVGLLALVALLGTVGQLMLIRALSMAEAGLLAPFNYAGLVYAMALGFVLFAEVPDAATLFGALVIAGAGIYVWHRETRARNRTKPPDVD